MQMLPRSAAGGWRGGCFAVAPNLCMVLTGSPVSGFPLHEGHLGCQSLQHRRLCSSADHFSTFQ